MSSTPPSGPQPPVASLVFCPHPDDELSAWTAVTFPAVFVYCTRGENAAAIKGQPGAAELRMFATAGFLWDMTGDPPLDHTEAFGRRVVRAASWVAVFWSAPDGGLTVETANAIVEAELKEWQPARVLNAAFLMPDPHPDHVALDTALGDRAWRRASVVLNDAAYEKRRSAALARYGFLGGYITDNLNGLPWGAEQAWTPGSPGALPPTT